jgi:hypothetical protein
VKNTSEEKQAPQAETEAKVQDTALWSLKSSF